jgi:hypothetical protein
MASGRLLAKNPLPAAAPIAIICTDLDIDGARMPDPPSMDGPLGPEPAG